MQLCFPEGCILTEAKHRAIYIPRKNITAYWPNNFFNISIIIMMKMLRTVPVLSTLNTWP